MSLARKQHERSIEGRWLALIMVSFVAVLAGLTLWVNIRGDRNDATLAAGSDLRVELAKLKKGRFFYFTYPLHPSANIRLLLQRGSDGVVRASFVSCRSCFKRVSYNRDWGGQLICGHCNHVMKLPNPGDKPSPKVNCVPVAIPYSVEGGQLTVHAQTIADTFQQWYTPTPTAR